MGADREHQHGGLLTSAPEKGHDIGPSTPVPLPQGGRGEIDYFSASRVNCSALNSGFNCKSLK